MWALAATIQLNVPRKKATRLPASWGNEKISGGVQAYRYDIDRAAQRVAVCASALTAYLVLLSTGHPGEAAAAEAGPGTATATTAEGVCPASRQGQAAQGPRMIKCARTVCKKRSADPKADGWTWFEFDPPPPKTGWWCLDCTDHPRRARRNADH